MYFDLLEKRQSVWVSTELEAAQRFISHCGTMNYHATDADITHCRASNFIARRLLFMQTAK
jgi:hypothetical protein